MKRLSLYLFIFILLVNYSCVKMDVLYSICIKNNTSKIIYFHIAESYPDTVLPATKEYVAKISANNRKPVDSSNPWEEQFKKEFPKDTLLIFFFDSDTINKYDWETIRKGYKIMEKRIYSKTDLQKANWYIYYP